MSLITAVLKLTSFSSIKRYWPLLMLGISSPIVAQTDKTPAPSQQELRSVRQEIDTLKKDIAQKQAVQKEAQSAIKESEQALAQTSQALATLEKRQQQSAQQLNQLRQQITQSQAKLKQTRQKVAQMLVKQYKQGQQDPLQLTLNAGDPNQSSREINYYQHIARAQQQLVTTLLAQQKSLSALTSQMEQELTRLNQLASSKSKEKNALQQDKSSHQQQLNKVAGEIKQGQTKLSKLQEDEKRLSNLIAQINRAIQQRKAEATRQAAVARKARQEAARKENERRRKLAEQAKQQGKTLPEEQTKRVEVETVERVADSSAAGRAFTSLRGKMRLPVSGQIVGRFGKARQEGSNWKGLFISTAQGQAVRSVADGTVVYADALRGFGNAVIVDHGSNYMTVYTGLSAMTKATGQSIKAGDTLGNTGTLDSGESGLYFEIRHMGKPLNPQAWAN